jgi:RNA polymerase sigma-70 factor (ECF subfamily)
MIKWGSARRELHPEDADGLLMQRFASGDSMAFETLVRKHQKAVINAAYRYTGNPSVAEELAQEVFVRVYRAAAGYRPEARFTTWLFTIVRNVCSNYRTRQGRHDRRVDTEVDPGLVAAGQDDPEAAVLRAEEQGRVRKAVVELPETLRLPFILNQFEHLRYEEIAQVMGLSLATVKVRIHRAREFLARRLLPLSDGGQPQDV